MSNADELLALGMAAPLASKVDSIYVDNSTAETIAGAKTFSGAMVATGGLVASGVITANGTVKIGGTTTDKIGFFGKTPITLLTGSAQTTVTATLTASGNGCGFPTQAAGEALVASVAAIQDALTRYGLWKGAA